ncbi:hypothetical protein CBL_20020 [Carabus blaptoides fortunei]
MTDYLGRLMELYRKLSSGGYGFTDRELALVMLIGLSDTYDLKPGARRKNPYNEEKKGSDDNEPKAMFTKKKGKTKFYNKKDDGKGSNENREGNISAGNANEKRQEKWYCCGKFGHISSSTNITIEQRESRTLYLNSGVTHHMTSANKLMNFKPAPSIVEAANKDKMQVTGSAQFFLCKENDGPGITLAKILHVPDLNGTLLSIGQVDKLGMFINIGGGKTTVSDCEGEIRLTGMRSEILYSTLQVTPTTKIAKSNENILWNRRLGHLNHEATKKIGNLPGDVLQEKCGACMEG